MLALHAKDPSSILGASTRSNNLESVEFYWIRIFVQLKLCKYNKEELENLILVQNLSYEAIGRLYGVTGNAIKKKDKSM